MSHYVVAVLTKEHPEDACFEDILAKYDENISVERYVSMTKEQIIAIRKKEIEDYKKGTYATYLRDPEKYKKDCRNEAHIEYVSNTFPNVICKMNDEELYEDYIKHYPTKEEIEYEGESYVDEDGNITSTYNPNSKWDWWSIGGRWSGELPLKNGEGVDWAKVSDVEWGHDLDVEKYIEENPDVKATYEKLITEGDFYRAEYYQSIYPTLEDFVKARASFVPFAIITVDGVWHEKGQMGWWGCSSETVDEAIDWRENFYDRFIKDNLDYYVTLIDCHI